ncbi:MAG: hypothetical protein N2117_07695 [Anaerolineales bacterium]|nr:hypothetical protein [Anaerolineales bacterium]MCX7755115.1 hypothetical protein [Anaerolineales bacterium]MDW8277532.1 hypothetical protein [Anaerolineales bacterium]
MNAKRWTLFLLSILAGVGLGLYYGWVVSPVEYVDTVPSTLRADYKADYCLMVAEVFERERDVEAAARRLALLGSEPPAVIASAALEFGRQHAYAPADLQLLQELSLALQTWQP